MKKNITILGSTGSIGTNTLDVLSRHLDRFQVFALTAATQVDLILSQCAQFKPQFAVMAHEEAGRKLAERVKSEGLQVEVLWGSEALDFVSSHQDVHAVMAAIVGAAVAGHFVHSRRVADAARAGAAHAHAQESVRSAAKAATDRIRVNVDNIRKQHAENRAAMDEMERHVAEVRMRVNARLHGEHYTGRQVDDQRPAQRIASYFANNRADRERYHSAERSGHFSPDYGTSQKTARPRLGSGLPDPPPAARPVPGSNKKSRKKKS